jgi:hypothetical protein
MDYALNCQPGVQMLVRCHALYVQDPCSSFTTSFLSMLLMNWNFTLAKSNMLELKHTCINQILVKTNLLPK